WKFRGYRAASAPAAYASRVVLPPPLQSSLPAGRLAFTGRELNPLDRYKRFQITFSFSFSGFILTQEGPSLQGARVNARSQRQLGCSRSAPTRALREPALLPGGDRAGALLAYEESLAIASVVRRDLLRVGLSVANPLPHRTQAPIVSVVDLDRLGEGERLILFVVKQAPDVHLAAITDKLAQLLAGDEAFVAQRQSSALPRGLDVRMLLKHMVALRLAER